MAFAYYSPEVVQSGQVPSSQSNFPKLVSLTDNRFKTVGNGGHVQNSNGYDIYFYSDSALTTRLAAEREIYNGTTGNIIAWVKFPTITTGSTVYIAYGDASISTDPNSDATYGTTSTWDSNYYGVWHLPDGTTLSANDSTSQANNGTVSTPTAIAGVVDGAATFNGTTDYIGLTNNLGLRPAGEFTVSAWLKISSSTANFVLYESYSQITAVSGISIGMNVFAIAAAEHHLSMVKGRNSGFGMSDWGGYAGTTTIDDGNWHYCVVTNDSSNAAHMYVDGGADEATRPFGGDFAPAYAVTTYSNIGKEKYDPINEGKFWNGPLDEIRFSNGIARSADWSTTEYRNQNAPGTFAVLGTEVNVGGGGVFWQMAFV